MRHQTVALVVVGLLLFIAGGAIAFVTVEKGAKNHQAPPAVAAPPVSVSAVVVTGDVAAGTTGKDLVAKGLVALKLIPHKQFVSTDLTNLQGLTDEVLNTAVAKGHAIATTDLTPSTSVISVPAGMDAVTVTTTGVASLAGYLQPGSDVDVFGNVTQLSAYPKGSPGVPVNTPVPCTELLMTNIEVLDVSNTSPPYAPPSSTTVAAGAPTTGRTIPPTLTVLLAVTPTQAQTIIFMTENEGLYLAQTQSGTTPPPPNVCVGTGVLTVNP